jgi:uncharacterized protein (DUF2249 family)
MVQKHKIPKTLNGLPEPVGISDHYPSSFRNTLSTPNKTNNKRH